jgi:CRP-like cAMP-binding protein
MKVQTANSADDADDLSLGYWLKQETPPTASQLSRLRRLAGRSKWRVIPKGSTIVRQDEPGDHCYVLCRGRAEVLLKADGGARRRIATLHAGTLIGEGALLTNGLRGATVRALEKCELLTVSRAELLDAMRADGEVATRVLDLLRLRSRPSRAPNIVAYERVDSKGEPLTILRDPQRGRYYRLSPTGWFLWRELDGSRTLADLCVDCEDAFKILAPQVVATR